MSGTYKFKYTGGLSAVEVEYQTVAPGETVEIADEATAAMLATQDDWEQLDNRRPKTDEPETVEVVETAPNPGG